MTTPAIFNGETVSLATSRLTLVFNQTHGESKYPGRFVIDEAASLSHFEECDEISDAAGAMLLAIVTDFEGDTTKASLRECQPAFRRLAGMLDLSARLIIAGVPFVLKYPESGLHPRYQGNIADVLIAFGDAPSLKSLFDRHLPVVRERRAKP